MKALLLASTPNAPRPPGLAGPRTSGVTTSRISMPVHPAPHSVSTCPYSPSFSQTTSLRAPSAVYPLVRRHIFSVLAPASSMSAPDFILTSAFSQVTELLFHNPGIQEQGQLWTGLWTSAQCGLLAPYLRHGTLRDGQRTLLLLGTRATVSAQHLWTRFTALVKVATGTFPTSSLPSSPSPTSSATPTRSPPRRVLSLNPAQDPQHQGAACPPTAHRRSPHLLGPLYPWQHTRGIQPVTTLYSAPPSLDPHGGCGPRMTPRHQPPCPGGQYLLKPGACIAAQRGESLLV